MLAWFEQRLQLKEYLTTPLLHPGEQKWYYVPEAFVLILLIVQWVTGLFIAPNWLNASLQPSFWQNVHHWSGHMLLLSVICLLLRNLYYNVYRKPRELVWFFSLFIVLTVVIGVISGATLLTSEQAKNLQICYQFLEQIPLLGNLVIEMLHIQQDPGYALKIIYVAHISLLPLLLLLLLLVYVGLMWRITAVAS